MAELPDWLRIPDGFAESSDPVDENPFPSSDARHGVWMNATRAAEQEWARVNAHWMAALSPENATEWHANLASARFAVWAKRGVQVVLSDADLKLYHRWLVQYANASLTSVADLFGRRPPPPGWGHSILLDIRNRLGEQIQYWKGEARRYRTEQEAARLLHVPESPSLRVTAKLLRRRKRLITEHRTRENLTAAEFARRLCISESAVRGIAREDRLRFSPDSAGDCWRR